MAQQRKAYEFVALQELAGSSAYEITAFVKELLDRIFGASQRLLNIPARGKS